MKEPASDQGTDGEGFERQRKGSFLRILAIGEGDAETWDAWSGISRSIVEHLRGRGHRVITADVDLYGVDRWNALARTFSPVRHRWWVKYHLGETAAGLRSRKAARIWEHFRENVDVVLQFGATFRMPEGVQVPIVIY
jgi:hypothetical protein